MHGFKRGEITIKNGIYGNKRASAYVHAGGVAVAKNGGRWSVYHVAGQTCIYHKLTRRLLAEAIDVARQVLELPVDWTLDPESKKFRDQFTEAVGRIREIAG